mgnify:CR=1 FL=1
MPETKTKKRDTLTDEIGKASLAPQEQTQAIAPIPAKQVAKLQKQHKDMGRPSGYTDAIADEICERLVRGESLESITKDEHMPHVATVYRWLNKYEEFCDMYARAREDQADTLADQIIAIADEHPETIPIYDKDGALLEIKVDSALLQWQRNRMEARKWTAAELKPRKYGERQILAGDADNPVQVKQTSEMLDSILLNMQLTKQSK